MFSERYKGGVNPKIKHIFKKYDKEIKGKFEWKEVQDGKFELKQKGKKK